jgi:arylsulfatase A
MTQLNAIGRRTFLQAAGLLMSRGAFAQSAKPWNFVFFLADDLGWSDLGCYGADVHETPNIDRFAAGATKFTQAYAAAPVCSPTRASIMTGKHPARLGMTIWHEGALTPPRGRKLLPAPSVENLPLSEATWSKLLHQAGYLTAHIGKWHLGTAGYYPEAHGFDINIGGSFWGAPQTYFYPYRGSRRFGGEYRYVPGLHWGAPGEYLTDRLTDEAMNVLERARERPFFLNMWHYSPHTPIEAPEATRRHFEGKLSPGQKHRHPGYAAMVKNLDENFGRLMRGLEQSGQADRTVVIFTSDNGGYTQRSDNIQITSNDPLRSGKGSLYEGGLRVPLIVRWPNVTKPGSVCDTPVISMDHYRTILDIAGLPGNAGQTSTSDGLSMVPLLKDPRARLRRSDLFFHYPHYYATTTPVSAVRSENWKLLEYFEDGRLELYDLENDLGEKHNLAGTMTSRAEQLRRKLQAWRESVEARLPTPNPGYKVESGGR